MSEISFPGLNLNFTINKVAIKIGEVEIYWYAIIIVFAFLLALLLMKRDDKKYNIRFESVVELALIVIPVSIICARLYYVLFRLDYYINNPLQIINLRNGGLAIYGGIIGAVIVIIIYCKNKRTNILDMLDYIVPYLPLGQAIGRWGNFINAEAHGTETSNILRMGITENGQYMEVHPTFLYESICTLIIFIILFILKDKRKYKGQLTYIYLTTYSFARAIIEGLRTDSLMLGEIRISQLLSIVLFIIFGIILIMNAVTGKEENG